MGRPLLPGAAAPLVFAPDLDAAPRAHHLLPPSGIAYYRSAMVRFDSAVSALTERASKQGGDDEGGTGLGVATRTRTRSKTPSPYKVLMLNDDYTPMEFVVHVLQRFFKMSVDDATRVMLHVHQRGVGVCGIFSYEVAETKVSQVIDFARENQHPLQCTLEKA
jgi:ATP-dependent Clp protease adaptor protein ClpS